MKPNNSETNEDSLEYQEEWLTAYLDGELSIEQRQVVEQRLASDPHAQRTLSELNVIRGLVQQLPVWSGPTVAMMPRTDTLPDARSELSDALELDQPNDTQPETGHLGRAHDLRSRVGSSRRSRRPTSGLVDWWRPIAIAAGLLMIVGVGYGLWSGLDSSGLDSMDSEVAMESSPSGEAASKDQTNEEAATAFGTYMNDESVAMKAQGSAMPPESMAGESMLMDRLGDATQANDMMQANELGDPREPTQNFGTGGLDVQDASPTNDPHLQLLDDSAIDAAIAGRPLGPRGEGPISSLPDNPPMQSFSFPAPGTDAVADVESQPSRALPPSAPARGTDSRDQESFEKIESAQGESLQNSEQKQEQNYSGTRQLLVGNDPSWTSEMIQLELLNNSMLTPLRADERGASFYAQLAQATTNRNLSTPAPSNNAMVVAQLPEAIDGREWFNQLVNDYQLQRMTEIETLATGPGSSMQPAGGQMGEATESEETLARRLPRESGDGNVDADGVVAPSVDELPAPNSALEVTQERPNVPAKNTAPRQMLLLFLKRSQAEQIVTQSDEMTRNSRSPQYLWITPNLNRDSQSNEEERVILLLNSKL